MSSSIPILETCKKRKRAPKRFGFDSFPESESHFNPTGAFLYNIRSFLDQCAEPEDYSVQGMPVWRTLLEHDKTCIVPLYTIEEDVNHSLNPFCNHCRLTGWNDHFVSKRTYHVVIPNDRDWIKPLVDGVLNIHSHLLHGLIHCNGYGHLICINGIEGGSNYLCGREIMDLWDRICKYLNASKISVEDLSKKQGMDLRLLHGVAYGHTWFGRWGYRFCRGSDGVSKQSYENAIEILSSHELDRVIQDFDDREQCGKIKCMIQRYRDQSESQLVTVRDLFKFMFTINSHSGTQKEAIAAKTAPRTFRITIRGCPTSKESSFGCRRFTSVIAHMDSRWPAKRLESVAEVIVAALKKHKSKFGYGGMTRQDLRDAVLADIGDTDLLDYVLKSMNNVIVGRHVVRHRIDKPRILVYTIEDLDKTGKQTEEVWEMPLPNTTFVDYDVVSLYNILLNYPESELLELATQAVLDSKYFVKDWPFRDEDEKLLRLFCQVMPDSFDAENLPPGVLVIVPSHATVFDLKQAAEKELRDTYCIMDQLVVTEIDDLDEMKDTDELLGAFKSGEEVLVNGIGLDLDSNLRHEGGADIWTVRCKCGAQDDDGERMVKCEFCEVWQHTRCCGIEDSEGVPPLFFCPGCCCSALGPPLSDSPLAFLKLDYHLLYSENVYDNEFNYDNPIGLLT